MNKTFALALRTIKKIISSFLIMAIMLLMIVGYFLVAPWGTE